MADVVWAVSDSGIGVREYYHNKVEYRQDGPYVSKRI